MFWFGCLTESQAWSKGRCVANSYCGGFTDRPSACGGFTDKASACGGFTDKVSSCGGFTDNASSCGGLTECELAVSVMIAPLLMLGWKA
jgi:hypothetical protein